MTEVTNQPMVPCGESENSGTTATWTHLMTSTLNSGGSAGNGGSSQPASIILARTGFRPPPD